jgi:hypothetical protein
MRIRVAGVFGAVALLCVSCSQSAKELPTFASGLIVESSDVRIGLTADDGVGGPAVLKGQGFEQLSPSSYVTLVENGSASGSLNDGDAALAEGVARNSQQLNSAVFARDSGAQCRAQVVQLTTTLLRSTATLEKVRIEIDTEMEVSLTGGAVGICEVLGEAKLQGHKMAEVNTKLYLYPGVAGIELFLGPRAPGKSPYGTMKNGEVFTMQDPSFYFGVGPGVYDLAFTLKLSVTCPADEPGSSAALKVSSKIGLR